MKFKSVNARDLFKVGLSLSSDIELLPKKSDVEEKTETKPTRAQRMAKIWTGIGQKK